MQEQQFGRYGVTKRCELIFYKKRNRQKKEIHNASQNFLTCKIIFDTYEKFKALYGMAPQKKEILQLLQLQNKKKSININQGQLWGANTYNND